MSTEKKYYAKLMLTGEYSVVVGSEALTVPLNKFHARLRSRDEVREDRFDAVTNSVSSLRNLITYLSSLPRNSFYASPEIKDMENMINSGFFIDSDIPNGYGIGSSGAVSALIYDQFFTKKESLSLTQKHKDLATIESCFHGRSSGVDAMTSYMNQSLHFLPDGTIEQPDKDTLHPSDEYNFFLLDSEHFFETGPLVHHFLEQMRDPSFEEAIRGDYFNLIKKLIRSLAYDSGVDPAMLIGAISDFQYKHFLEMIPDNIRNAWLEGQASHLYYLKLNGSGGGYVLGITHNDNRAMVEQMLGEFKILWI